MSSAHTFRLAIGKIGNAGYSKSFQDAAIEH